MAKPTDLTTPNSRKRLSPLKNGAVHWRFLAKGKALWIPASRWHGRLGDVGRASPRPRHQALTTLGTAYDSSRPADGETVLSFDQASRAALEWCEDQERALEGLEPVDRAPYTVARTMADYLEWVRAHRKAPQQVE